MRLKLYPESMLATQAKFPTLLLDGKYLAYRTQYSKQGGLSHDGIKTGVFYGFFNTIQQLLHKFYPINIVIMWDKPKGVSVRKAQFAGYKQRDQKLSDADLAKKKEFAECYEQLIQICDDLGFASYMLDGYEADDIFALWCNRFPDSDAIMITRDEDLYQLLNCDYVKIYSPDDKVLKDEAWFQKTYKIPPSKWHLVKAIGGCKSDTIPGIAGVGEESALKYIRGEAKATLKQKIEDNYASVLEYIELTMLPHRTLWGQHLAYKHTHVDQDKFFSFCQRFGFRSFIDKMGEFEPLFEM
jgi:5'-3' exonuclease